MEVCRGEKTKCSRGICTQSRLARFLPCVHEQLLTTEELQLYDRIHYSDVLSPLISARSFAISSFFPLSVLSRRLRHWHLVIKNRSCPTVSRSPNSFSIQGSFKRAPATPVVAEQTLFFMIDCRDSTIFLPWLV